MPPRSRVSKGKERCSAGTAADSKRSKDRPLPRNRITSPHNTIKQERQQQAASSKSSKKRELITITLSDSEGSTPPRVSSKVQRVAKRGGKRTSPPLETSDYMDDIFPKQISPILGSNGARDSGKRSYKPPQVDDAAEVDMEGTICDTVETFYMLPQDNTRTYPSIVEKSAMIRNPRLPNQAAADVCLPAPPPAPPPPPNSTSCAPPPVGPEDKPSQSTISKTDTLLAPDQRPVKTEQNPTQHPLTPQQAPSTPFLPLSQKMTMAGEFSDTFGLADHIAYQQLLSQDWNVDRAALAFLETRGRRKQEEGGGEAGKGIEKQEADKTDDVNAAAAQGV